jgi:quercetin dioxygenase-like cupin family protein
MNADMTPYTHRNVLESDDDAPGIGIAEWQESRFLGGELGAERTGFAHHRFKPGLRQGFGHRHERAEEVYLVLSGSGRVKLDDDVVELVPLDVVRVAPGVLRSWEAGPDGLEVLAFGPREDDEAEFVPGWWTD